MREPRHAPRSPSSKHRADISGRALGVSFTLHLKPTKTDQLGISGATRTFVVDETESALSAALAIRDMLEGDPIEVDSKRVPLFRDPETCSEIRSARQCACFSNHCAQQDCRTWPPACIASESREKQLCFLRYFFW